MVAEDLCVIFALTHQKVGNYNNNNNNNNIIAVLVIGIPCEREPTMPVATN